MKTQAAGLFAIGLLAALGCQEQLPEKPKKAAPPRPPPAFEIDSAHLAQFAPLPDVMEATANPVTPEKVALGQMLYFEPRLSKNHDISCDTCHDLARFGVDGAVVSTGHRQQKGKRNSPTVYNAALQFVQFWDGRSETVEDQAKGPMLNAVEMAMPSGARVEEILASIPGYVEAFQKAFPDDAKPVTFDNFARAVGAFERKLITPSRWDAYLKGDRSALTEEEKKGFTKFVEVGCPQCHVGPLVGGTMYQKAGLKKPWPDQKDKGRGEVTKSPSDDMMFKTPQLRNVEHTAPYFHDGSVASLDEAVKVMARLQLDKELSDGDTRLLVAWLKTLSGTVPAELAKKPALPESSAKTPKPDPR